jgi:hypothetical protein
VAHVVCEFSESVLDDGVGEEGGLSRLVDDPFWWDIKLRTGGDKSQEESQEET